MLVFQQELELLQVPELVQSGQQNPAVQVALPVLLLAVVLVDILQLALRFSVHS